MKVALTIADHLRRASQVYPQRTACVDEPLQPAASFRLLAPLACGRAHGDSRPRSGLKSRLDQAKGPAKPCA